MGDFLLINLYDTKMIPKGEEEKEENEEGEE
jgi:hypothetical protein